MGSSQSCSETEGNDCVDGVRTRAQAGWIGWRRASGLGPDCGDLLGDVKLASAREEDGEVEALDLLQ